MLTYEMLEPKVQNWEYDNWNIITFPVSHNVPNWGIVIKSKIDNEKLCYMTDFNKAPLIEGCDIYLYEINYIEGYIDQMIEKNKDLRTNGFVNHNSLENAVTYFQKLKDKPKEIICCHLSPSNSIKSKILKTMQPFADKVRIAEKEK